VIRYTVQVWQVTGSLPVLTDIQQVTADKTYELRDSCYNERHRFLFHNSLAGFDCVYFDGKRTDSLAAERKAANRLRDNQFSIQYEEISDYSNESFVEYEVNSGWLNSADFEWIRQMGSSNAVFYNIDGFFYKISIDSFESTKKSDDDVYAVKIKFRVGYKITTQGE